MSKYQPYPEYEDSGVEWLGNIPSEWELVRGKFRFKNKKELNKQLQCLDRLALTLNGVIERSMDADEGLQPTDFFTYQIFNKGDLVFKLIDLENFKTSRVGLVWKRGIMSPAYIRLIPAIKLNNKYFYYYYYDLYLRGIYNELGGQGVRSALNVSDLLELPVFSPTYEEQTTIANFLDRETAKIDTLIEKQQELIELLKEKRQAVISHTVTKGLDPNVKMKDSGVEWLGEVPEDWNIMKFNHCAFIGNGQVDPRDMPYREYTLIAPNHIEKKTGKLLYLETAAEQGADSGKYISKKGEVIYSKIRPALAKVCISPMNNVLCSADMYSIYGINGLTNPFLFWFLLSKQFTAYAILQSDRVAMPKLNRDTLGEAKIPFPTITEQLKIVHYLDTQTTNIDTLIEKSNQAINLLKERRTALISATVTGKIDVRGEN